MARYIDADKLLEKAEEIEWFNEGTGFYDHINIVHEYDVETAPTADVVPKSEVDKTIAEWAYLHADVLNKLEKAKTEVAKEIFEEIESRLGIGHDILDAWEILAELKNKYTEGE